VIEVRLLSDLINSQTEQGRLMTHNARSAFVGSVPTRAGVSIAGAILSAAITPGELAARAPSTAPETPQLIYSPWAKFCGKGEDPGAKQVCTAGKDARTEAGQPVVAAALIEPEGGSKKLFRVTLPSPLRLRSRTLIIIDDERPISGEISNCVGNGCIADHEAPPRVYRQAQERADASDSRRPGGRGGIGEPSKNTLRIVVETELAAFIQSVQLQDLG
jgi:invasion protein IalB